MVISQHRLVIPRHKFPHSDLTSLSKLRIMITLSAQDLINYGALQSSSTLTFMGKVFVRGQSFSLTTRERAIKMAEKSLQKGCPCLLVDSDTDTTLWVEMQNQTLAPQPQDISNIDPDSMPTAPSMRLTYRGQPITSSSPQLPANSSHSTHSVQGRVRSKDTRTMNYRGQTFEVPAEGPTPTPSPNHSSENDESEKRSPITPSPKRKIQYRGRWIEVD